MARTPGQSSTTLGISRSIRPSGTRLWRLIASKASGRIRSSHYPASSAKGRSHSRQSHSDFGELARLCIDLDRTTMLLHNDVVTDGEAEPGSFSRRLCCEERVEHLFFYFRWNTRAV